MKKPTVRQKVSKKQQREQVEKRRAAGRSKQAAYVARQKTAGKSLVRFWVTDEEKIVLEKIRSMLPKLVELERKKPEKVSADHTENFSSEGQH